MTFRITALVTKGRVFILALFFAMTVLIAPDVLAQATDNEKPPEMETLQDIKKSDSSVIIAEQAISDEDGPLRLQIRRDAQKEAALSYGARGGLSHRTYEIMKDLERRGPYLDRVFNFRQLLIKAPSGMLIEPPVIVEADDALLIEGDGQEAAIAERVYNINVNARIVSAPREWRTYLYRDWGDVAPPPDLLRPENAEEREKWKKWVKEGWNAGIMQADDIFQQDLDRLVADFRGMVRYRLLLAQGMVSKPFALHEDRGITGGGDEMRVGDRAIRITGPSQLNPGASEWQPADR